MERNGAQAAEVFRKGLDHEVTLSKPMNSRSFNAVVRGSGLHCGSLVV